MLELTSNASFSPRTVSQSQRVQPRYAAPLVTAINRTTSKAEETELVRDPAKPGEDFPGAGQ